MTVSILPGVGRSLYQEYFSLLMSGSVCGGPCLMSPEHPYERHAFVEFPCGWRKPVDFVALESFDRALRDVKEAHDGWHSQY